MKARIYTKSGDKGETSLVDGSRVSKGNHRLETYGTLDELNSIVGLLRSRLSHATFELQIAESLRSVQNNLFNIGSHLACVDSTIRAKLPSLSELALATIEDAMDQWEAELPPLREFILPGGHELAALSHLARTVCRRADRHMIRLRDEGADLAPDQMIYINRLSDWFFLLARKFNFVSGSKDFVWSKG